MRTVRPLSGDASSPGEDVALPSSESPSPSRLPDPAGAASTADDVEREPAGAGAPSVAAPPDGPSPTDPPAGGTPFTDDDAPATPPVEEANDTDAPAAGDGTIGTTPASAGDSTAAGAEDADAVGRPAASAGRPAEVGATGVPLFGDTADAGGGELVVDHDPSGALPVRDDAPCPPPADEEAPGVLRPDDEAPGVLRPDDEAPVVLSARRDEATRVSLAARVSPASAEPPAADGDPAGDVSAARFFEESPPRQPKRRPFAFFGTLSVAATGPGGAAARGAGGAAGVAAGAGDGSGTAGGVGRGTIAYADVGQPEPPSSGESDIQPRRLLGRAGVAGSPDEGVAPFAGAALVVALAGGGVPVSVPGSFGDGFPGSMQMCPFGKSAIVSPTVGRVSLTSPGPRHGGKPQLTQHSDNWPGLSRRCWCTAAEGDR